MIHFVLLNKLLYKRNYHRTELHFVKKLLQNNDFKEIESIKETKQVKQTNKVNYVNGYQPKTTNQEEYKKALLNNNIHLLFCLGPAGSGKTLFACQHAIQSLKKSKINKIIITRPTITIEEDIGFLPGNIVNKMHPWTIPIFDIFEEFYTKKEITNLVSENIIEIAPLGYMQGRTFKNSIIIADEMQNSTPNQMFMLLTRIGNNSKMILTGDLMQTNNPNNGLIDIIKKLNYKYYPMKESLIKDGIQVISLTHSDIQRHDIVSKITTLYMKQQDIE
jgi:phosphate starvation-inducible PhoH-like protein